MDIQGASLRYLSYRDRSTKEMTEYLEKKGFGAEDIEEEINRLKTRRYIDDARFARQHILYALEKGRGSLRIERDLKNKGICQEDMEDGIYQAEEILEMSYEECQIEQAEKIAVAMMEGLEFNEKNLAKVARRLSGRGFKTGIIYDTIGRFQRG